MPQQRHKPLHASAAALDLSASEITDGENRVYTWLPRTCRSDIRGGGRGGGGVDVRASHGATDVESAADFTLCGAVCNLGHVVQQLGASLRRDVGNAQVVQERGAKTGHERSRRPQSCAARLIERYFRYDARGGNCGCWAGGPRWTCLFWAARRHAACVSPLLRARVRCGDG
jgi:hypothetical protein